MAWAPSWLPVSWHGIPKHLLEYYGIAALPLVGQASTMSYNLPEFGPSNLVLVINCETLGCIWIGNILVWNDLAIATLNPGLALPLPVHNITLGILDEDDNFYLSQSRVIQLVLSSFYPPFDVEFKQM